MVLKSGVDVLNGSSGTQGPGSGLVWVCVGEGGVVEGNNPSTVLT